MRNTLVMAVFCLSVSVVTLGCGAVESGACTVGGSEGCDSNATCVDEGGTATCRCDTGFTGDGMACSDVDECTAGTDDCVAVATCSNNAGGFTCACPGGYSGDGTTAGTGCNDVDECATTPCDAQATCSNVPGTFQCACNSGYTGTGITCAPVDCGALTAPANGNVMTPSGTTFGQAAMYGCSSSYTLVGGATRMCLATGQWSGSAPVCNPCTVQTVTLTAVQSQSVNYPSGGTYNDNNTRAYQNPTSTGCAGGGGCDITGWIGFNTTSIPDAAVVQALTLRVYATTVAMSPTVRVQYSALNDWDRTTPGTMFARTVPAVSSPLSQTVNTFNAHNLTIGSHTWSTDLADNWLTLGVYNTSTVYSYTYYEGSDVAGNRPTLQVTYCN